MRKAALLLSALLVASSAFGEDEAQAKRIAELEKENLALKRKVAEFRDRVNELYAELKDKTYTARVTIPLDGQPQPEHLKGIALPERPTKHDVRR